MGRPAVVSSAQILSAARDLFLEQGFGATTAAIARRAGVSEGSIFKRFPTKEALFFAALGIAEPSWIDELDKRAGKGPVRDNLVQVFLGMVEFFRELMPRIIVTWSCRAMAHGPHAFFSEPDSPPARGLRTLTRYLTREAELGRIRLKDPEVLARALLGSAQNFVMTDMMRIHVREPLTASYFASELVDLLFSGLNPEAESP